MNRTSPSPQSKSSNNLVKNEVKNSQNQQRPNISNNIETVPEKDGPTSPKTPFARQPVNKNGRNLAFTNKVSTEEAKSAKEEVNTSNQPFVTQSNYGQKNIKPTPSNQNIKT